jgi:hypothetical protein
VGAAVVVAVGIVARQPTLIRVSRPRVPMRLRKQAVREKSTSQILSGWAHVAPSGLTNKLLTRMDAVADVAEDVVGEEVSAARTTRDCPSPCR